MMTATSQASRELPPPSETSTNYKFDGMPAEPRNDKVGRLVAQGSLSQYTLQGGHSACTPIALVACYQALSINKLTNIMTPDSIDDVVQEGVQCYNAIQTGAHTSVEELWDLPVFADTVRHLKKCAPQQGSVVRRQDLIDAFQACIDFAVDCSRMAIFLTKSGETVLCVADCQNPSYVWYLFDPHGQSHDSTKLAYWKQYDSFHRLLDAFLSKYPPQHFDGNDSLQSSMYNLFEALPVVHLIGSGTAQATREGERVHRSDFESDDGCICASVSPGNDRKSRSDDTVGKLQDGVLISGGAGRTLDLTTSIEPLINTTANEQVQADTTSYGATASVASLQASLDCEATTAKEAQLGLFDVFNREDFQCAITFDIMADPVVCSDGKTYDRPNIERHFEAREAQEEARIAEEEFCTRGEFRAPSQQHEATCCGANRPPIQLTSPITGESVDGVLTPSHQIEQQIVRLIESNAFMLTDEELDDWRERRAEKRQRDQQREEEKRRAEEREEEMRRNATEAEQRRTQEIPSLPEELSLQIRIDRDTNDETQCLGNDDLGISVALSGKENRIPASYARQGHQDPRCMVSCCAVSLNSNTYCARCQRLVCDDCLSFGVSDIAPGGPGGNVELSRVCFECVTQIVDAMESQDIRIRQKRVVLIELIERYLTELSNKASTKQDAVVRHEVHDEFGDKMEQAEQSIRRLESQLRSIREQVRQQESRAAEAAADSGLGRTTQRSDIDELRNHLSDLEQEYNQSLQEPDPDDNDDLLKLVCRRSNLAQQLEEAQTRLTMAESSKNIGSELVSEVELPNAQIEMERLQGLLDKTATVKLNETEEEQLARILEQSSILDKMDKLSLQMAVTQSMGAKSTSALQSPQCTSASYPALQNLIIELTGFLRESRPWGFFGRRKNSGHEELAVVVADLETERNRFVGLVKRTEEWHRSISMLEVLLVQLDNLNTSHPPEVRQALQAALREISHERSTETESAPSLGKTDECQTDSGDEDLLAEFVRLSNQDVSQLSHEQQFLHIARLSEIDAVLASVEERFFRRERETIPSMLSAVGARQDLAAVGNRIEAWPLPLGLEYPTARMGRQLEALRNTLELRRVESRRSAEEFITEQHRDLLNRQEALEDDIAAARRTLQDAESHAREEEERRNERAERRRREEEARIARERALREEARRASEAADALRRQHEAEEDATRQAFANAGGEGGARALGGTSRGDFRMCRRCRAGPIENMACADLSAHNNADARYKGRAVASVQSPNACPHCNWFNSDWHSWPYWDGIYGPH